MKTSASCFRCAAACFCLLAGGVEAATHVIQADGAGDYPTVQAAIDASNDGDEIVLMPGTYTGDGNRDIDYGGKAITVRGTDPNDPNVVEGTVIDCGMDPNQWGDPNHWADPNYEVDPNYHHRGFHFHSGEDANSVVAGVTVTNGYSHVQLNDPNDPNEWDDPNRWGGGMLCESSSPTVVRCLFIGNAAVEGGGMCNVDSNPQVTLCTFVANLAGGGGGGMAHRGDSSPNVAYCTFSGNSAGYGGAMENGGGGSPTTSDCVFTDNSAWFGGGIENWGSCSPAVRRCTFIGNQAEWEGGAMVIHSATGNFSNCIIVGNASSYYGGGISCSHGSSPEIHNCILSGNSAADFGGGIVCYDGDAFVTNCILWGNTAPDGPEIALRSWDAWMPSMVVQYTVLKGGLGDVDVEDECTLTADPNIVLDQDPLFADPNGPDGDPNTWEDNDYHLSPQSPCIDAGDPNGDYAGLTDIDGESRVLLARVDIGADEATECIRVHNLTQDTWHSHIQDAIDASDPGDEVVLSPLLFRGSGNQNLDFGGKAITVRGLDPNDPNTVEMTVIAPLERGFHFHNGEDANSVVEGLTIVGGSAFEGGGILCDSSSPTISRCTLRGGLADWGGALCCTGMSSPQLKHCIIRNNHAWQGGGAIYCTDDSNPALTGCLVVGNIAEGVGAAVFADSDGLTITNCTILQNTGPDGYSDPPAVSSYGLNVSITNCIVRQNPGGQIDASPDPSVNYCNIEGGWSSGVGNIDTDPLFLDPNGPDGDPNTTWDNDYHLQVNSPCINRGDANAVGSGQVDIDGEQRVMNGQVDIGFDEVELPPPTVRHVPSEYATIQTAIDACVHGDTVVIAEGTYTGDGNRDIDFLGKRITVRSIDPADPNVVAATIIDCQGTEAEPHRGFTFRSSETHDAVLDGLTILNGYGPEEDVELFPGYSLPVPTGGGVVCIGASPFIRRCYIAGGEAEAGGGIAAWHNANPKVENCRISGNSASEVGGGIAAWMDCAIELLNTTITCNTADIGGGVLCYDTSLISNCTILGNQAGSRGGGLALSYDASETVSNCILRSNTPDQIDYSGYESTVQYCNVEGGWTGAGPGNIDADPLFVDPNGPDGDPNTWEDNDYHLSPNSPCVNAGDPNNDYTGQLDIDGQIRANGIVDMGADEVWPADMYTLSLTVENDHMGVVTLSPDQLLDPNSDPNDPNAVRQYAAGTVVTLEAAPIEGKMFKHWLIFDPNYPGDAYHATEDTNQVLTLAMDQDYEIEAAFKCGSGAGPMLPMTLGVLGMWLMALRNRRQER